MNYFKAVLYGIVVWMTANLFLITMSKLPFLFITSKLIYSTFFIFLIVFLVFLSYLFYTENKMNGFLLGGIFFGVVTILNLIIAIPVYFNSSYLGFFRDWKALISMVLIFIIPGIYGLINRRVNNGSGEKQINKNIKPDEVKKGKINVQQSPNNISILQGHLKSFRKPLDNIVDSDTMVKFVTKSR